MGGIFLKYRGMLAALLLCLPLASCARNVRFDYSELNIRLREADDAFCFRETELLYADSTYYAFYAVNGEDGMLLTMRGDETGLLDRVTLTLDADAKEAAGTFVSFAEALARVFIPGVDMDALREKTGLPDAASGAFDGLFRGIPGRYETGFYRAELIPGNEGCVFAVEYL